jgi:hypothetical protein
MTTIDLWDAYYSVLIDINYKNYLKFYWKGTLCRFTCLPNASNGLASGHLPDIVKPIYAMLRQLGHLNASYIDDSYLQGDTGQEWKGNV